MHQMQVDAPDAF